MALISSNQLENIIGEFKYLDLNINTSIDILEKHETTCNIISNSKNTLKYGDLILLGYNGSLPEGDKGRKKSKFTFGRRTSSGPNGVVFHSRQAIKDILTLKNIISQKSDKTYSVAYTFLNENSTCFKNSNSCQNGKIQNKQEMIVYDEYRIDMSLDMFQIGRSPEKPIDFVVLDTASSTKCISNSSRTPHSDKNQMNGNDIHNNSNQLTESTISRFACRITIERDEPFKARIFAAGFDTSKNIFLGPKAVKWRDIKNNIVDGLTTNGILTSHEPNSWTLQFNCPKWKSYGNKEGLEDRKWYEISVEGRLYTLRSPQSMNTCGTLIETESNILTDWSLIDICGATLLWRSNRDHKIYPNNKDIEFYIEKLNSAKPQCPVRLSTLVVPKRMAKNTESHFITSIESEAYVYLKCGHVQGLHQWGQQENQMRKCPICQKVGPIAPLVPGYESSFYRGRGPLTHSFVPCGHMTNEITALYWSNITIPSADFKTICPFCASELAQPNSYVKLHFQGDG